MKNSVNTKKEINMPSAAGRLSKKQQKADRIFLEKASGQKATKKEKRGESKP